MKINSIKKWIAWKLYFIYGILGIVLTPLFLFINWFIYDPVDSLNRYYEIKEERSNGKYKMDNDL